MDAAYKNKKDIRERVAKVVNTYHPANPEVTVVKDGKYQELVKDTYTQQSLWNENSTNE